MLGNSKAIIFTPDEAETITNMVFYYQHHGAEKILNNHPYFLVDDLEKVLSILEKITQE